MSTKETKTAHDHFGIMNLDILKFIGNDVYKWCETGDWLLSGKIVYGIDGAYIQWYA